MTFPVFVIRTAAATAVASIAFTASAVADDKKDDGWMQLFNGKDFTGWKLFDPTSGSFEKGVIEKKNADGKVIAMSAKTKPARGEKEGKEITLWQIKDGMIVGGGPMSHIFSDAEADDFTFRVEAKINDKGNSGMFFRSGFRSGVPKGYEAQINATHGDRIKTGSLYPNGEFGLDKVKSQIAVVMDTAPHKAEEFFTQEVTCVGNEITITVNGKQTLKWKDPNSTFMKGHFALQGHDPGSVMTFRKVEYKPLKK